MSKKDQPSSKQNASESNGSEEQYLRGDLWTQWALEAQKGDKELYNKLLSEVASFVRNYLLSRVANPDWADDITQEVLISVHKSLKTFQSGRPFRPWLMAIVSFRMSDFLRRHYAQRGDKKASLDDVGFQADYVTDVAHAGEYKDIERALENVPEKQRKIFSMMRIQGYTAEEVAKAMNMSASAVKVSVHRTANKLKSFLAQGHQ